MEQNNAQNGSVVVVVDDAVKNADVWELSQNPVYRNLQQKLIERTVERDVYKCVR